MTENKDNLWIKEGTDGLYIKWGELPFNIINSIRWQDKFIRVEINYHKIEHGAQNDVIFIYNNQKYECKFTKWKWSGGSHGVAPPTIRTNNHELIIRVGLCCVEFKDKSVLTNSINPFQVLKTPI